VPNSATAQQSHQWRQTMRSSTPARAPCKCTRAAAQLQCQTSPMHTHTHTAQGMAVLAYSACRYWDEQPKAQVAVQQPKPSPHDTPLLCICTPARALACMLWLDGHNKPQPLPFVPGDPRPPTPCTGAVMLAAPQCTGGWPTSRFLLLPLHMWAQPCCPGATEPYRAAAPAAAAASGTSQLPRPPPHPWCAPRLPWRDSAPPRCHMLQPIDP
jgi:hypothetical protein